MISDNNFNRVIKAMRLKIFKMLFEVLGYKEDVYSFTPFISFSLLMLLVETIPLPPSRGENIYQFETHKKYPPCYLSLNNNS